MAPPAWTVGRSNDYGESWTSTATHSQLLRAEPLEQFLLFFFFFSKFPPPLKWAGCGGPRGLLILCWALSSWPGPGGCAEGSSFSGRLDWGTRLSSGSLRLAGCQAGPWLGGVRISGEIGLCSGVNLKAVVWDAAWVLGPQLGFREAAQGHVNCLMLQNSPSLPPASPWRPCGQWEATGLEVDLSLPPRSSCVILGRLCALRASVVPPAENEPVLLEGAGPGTEEALCSVLSCKIVKYLLPTGWCWSPEMQW